MFTSSVTNRECVCLQPFQLEGVRSLPAAGNEGLLPLNHTGRMKTLDVTCHGPEPW